MTLRFTKMHGLGNDFVVIERLTQQVDVDTALVRHLADRRFGIGCDQLLLVDPSDHPDADFRYRIFNADGGEVEQCGNGARCFARFVRDHGFTDKDEILVNTAAGLIRPRLLADGQVEVDMGRPWLEPADIPFQADARADLYPLEVAGETLAIAAVSMGNPHAVLRVENVDTVPVERLGPLIENHPRFPRRVNAGFMQVMAPDHIRLRVFERGAGETLACGTGACAAMVAGRVQGWLAEAVRVDLPGGRLVIRWPGDGHGARDDASVLMTGPAETVFEGEIQS
ncbi:MAG: diaminopimelate epimerase [Gammaproteobacteria bacterium]|nr:diaminopimelate epimerase [Gammaproteobacteria bacterium]MCP5138057.1 diaminopimelate epimerase [Gammaproteobacteria bacterium]